jgi:hypothetical protein
MECIQFPRKLCIIDFHIPDSAVYNCLIGRLCYEAVQNGTHQLDAVSTFVVIVAGLHDTIDASKRRHCVDIVELISSAVSCSDLVNRQLCRAPQDGSCSIDRSGRQPAGGLADAT